MFFIRFINRQESNMNILKKICLAITVIGLPFASLSAADFNNNEGWYATVFGGMGLSGNSKTDDVENSENYKLKDKTGFAGGIALGWRFAENFRIEAQGSYMGSDIDDIKQDGASVKTGTWDSHYNTWNAMGNVYFDFGSGWMVMPYIGAGAGMAFGDFKMTGTVDGNAVDIDKSKSTFAYQAIVGLRYPINDKFDLGLEYRYFDTSKFTVSDKTTTDEWKVQHNKHLVLVNLSMDF